MKFAIVKSKESLHFGKRVMLPHFYPGIMLYDIFEPYGMLIQRGVSANELAII